MRDFRSDVFLRLLATGWVGMTVGLVADSWGAAAQFVTLVYGLIMATYAWVGWESPSPALADQWDEMTGRERRAVTWAVWRGADPGDPRLAEPPSTQHLLLLALEATVALAAVVIAALNEAPLGWIVAGAILPVAVVAVGAVSLRRGRTTS